MYGFTFFSVLSFIRYRVRTARSTMTKPDLVITHDWLFSPRHTLHLTVSEDLDLGYSVFPGLAFMVLCSCMVEIECDIRHICAQIG